MRSYFFHASRVTLLDIFLSHLHPMNQVSVEYDSTLKKNDARFVLFQQHGQNLHANVRPTNLPPNQMSRWYDLPVPTSTNYYLYCCLPLDVKLLLFPIKILLENDMLPEA